MNDMKTRLNADGFTRIESLFPLAELNKCESIIDSLMGKKSLSAKLFKSNMSENPIEDKNSQFELKRPSMVSIALRNSEVFKLCQKVANEYFNGSAHYLFDHAIYKMPQSQTITPWHQDQAYLGEDIIPSIHFWIPFQDTYINNGAMQFIKNSHHEIFPHERAYPGNSHILQAINVPLDRVCTMDICKGDVSLHTNLTLHSATTNSSDQVRKAWIIHFGQKSQWQKHWLTFKRRLRSKAT